MNDLNVSQLLQGCKIERVECNKPKGHLNLILTNGFIVVIRPAFDPSRVVVDYIPPAKTHEAVMDTDVLT